MTTTDPNNVPVGSTKRISDTNWIRQSFLTDSASIDKLTLRNRTFSTASFKFGDTTLGGSIEINPPPQFTRNADVKVPSITSGRPVTSLRPVLSSTGPKGLGRYYSEALDDNKHIISMRFGVPQFNSLTSFFSHFYNYEAGTLARSGRSTGAFYTLGKAVGFILPLINIPLLLLSVGGAIWNALSTKPNSRYYYLKPTMPLYWNAVQSIVNIISVNKGITPRVMSDLPQAGLLNGQYNFTQADLTKYASLMPDVILTDSKDSTVGVNVYAMATRYQRLNRAANLKMQELLKNAKGENDVLNAMSAVKNNYFSGVRLDLTTASNPSFKKYLDAYLSSAGGQPPTGSLTGDLTPTAIGPDGKPVASTSSNTAGATDVKPSMDVESYPETTPPGWSEFIKAELDDGSQFISFRVEESGSVGESFSNSVRDSDIASKMNSLAAQSRSTRFSLAGGNLDSGFVGKAIGGFVQSVSDTVAGVVDGTMLSGLASFGGAAFVDIPKHWESSMASLPRMNYSFTLVSPYGNKLSQLFNLYVPLAMILAGALPLSTGRQSYSSPFICELYDRGRAQTRLGMIDSLSINRGVGNLGFDNSGNAMAIEVSFSVVNLTSILHMPIAQGFSLTSPLKSFVDQDSAFSDYLAVLGNLTLDEQIYFVDNLRRSLTNARLGMRSWFSRAHTAQWFTSISPISWTSAFYSGVVNR